MKIGIDYHWASGIFRGTNTYVKNLVSELSKLDDKTEYFLFSAKNEGIDFGNNKNLIHRKMYTNSGYFNMLLGFSYQALIDKIDVFHSQYITPVIMHCKKIVTIHDILFETHSEYFPNHHSFLLNKLTSLAIQKANKVIAVSGFTRNELVRVYGIPVSRIQVILEGVSKNFKKITNRNLVKQKLMNYNIDTSYLLYVGRIVPIKNISGLFEALYHTKKKGYQALKLVIVGDKDNLFVEEKCFEVLRKLGLMESVIFIKGVSEEILTYLYNGASAFILPSFGEGFGLPVLEAMACGTPVIASNVCAIPEITGDAAILVDPYNIKEIASAITKVLDDKKLREDLVIKGIERTKCFSWEKCARETLEVYEEVYKK